MKLTEAKLKQLIVEVIEEEEATEKGQIPDLGPIKTVDDFFKQLNKFEAMLKAAKSTRSGLEFVAGFLLPGYGNITHWDDGASALADALEAVNTPGGESLYEYEGEFPLLAFLDLDPLIENNVAPQQISAWIKQLRPQLESLGLSGSSPMPNADELFLGWFEKQPAGDVLAPAFRKAIDQGRIKSAPEEYDKKRTEWNREQRVALTKSAADASDKISGWKRLMKLIFDREPSQQFGQHKADAQRFSSQSPQFFESKK